MSSEFTFSFATMLLHSLWIAVAILGTVKVLFVAIDQRRSEVRYAIAAGGLFTFVVATGFTFVLLFPENAPAKPVVSADKQVISIAFTNHHEPAPMLKSFVASNTHLILSGWAIGASIFLLRLTGGLWYVRTLTRSGTQPGEHISTVFDKIVQRITSVKRIRLVQSTGVNAPLVVGVLKPIIILPAGFATGISSEQLEAVLAHELVHIARRDYLINVIQSVVEAVFFFNPFVWALSALVRREREHVCDDAVVKLGFDKLTYVRALATLEESRLRENVLALSLADNKKFLLNRIKRLMEKSIKTYSTSEKLIPVALVVVGLSCAAWLTVEKAPGQNTSETYLVQVDTVKKPAKPTVPSTPSTPTPDIDIPQSLSIDVDIPEIPEFEIPEFPEFNFPEIPAIPDFPEFDVSRMGTIEIDSIPFGAPFYKQFDFDRLSDFEFANEFELSRLRSIAEALQEEIPQHLERVKEMRLEEIAQRNLAIAHEAMADQQEVMEKVQQAMLHQQVVSEERMRAIEAEVQEMQQRTVSLQKALKEQLVKDGYLAPDEKIERLQIDDEGNIRVNDKEIRDSDRGTYKKILNKHKPRADRHPGKE